MQQRFTRVALSEHEVSMRPGPPRRLLGAQQSTLDPASDAAERIADLWWVLLGVSGAVVAVVTMLVLVVAAKARAGRPARVPITRTESRFGVRLVFGAGVAVPILILVALFALTLATLPAVSAPDEAEADFTVEVVGNQWWWEVRYPDQGIVTANEIHIPAGRPVRIEVTTDDVIHSFWVPQLQRKIDLVPGRRNSILLESERTGVFRGQCAEFCGLQHANMAFFVVVEEPEQFEAWARANADPAAEPVTESEERGQDVFLEIGCADCHTIAGTPADGDLGPDLTHLASRRSLAAGTIPNRRGYLAGWVVGPQHIKPGNKMPGLNIDGDQLQDLLAYLESLE